MAGLLLGLVLAAGSYRFPFLEEILEPIVGLLKAIPVASFVVLLLIWLGSSFLAVAISFLVVLPQIYISTLGGLKSAERSLLEMADVFHMPFWNRAFYIYRPALRPFLDSSLRISLGMSWKSGVAAEVIGTPGYSIGEKLYMSKIYLDTPGVFAWTAVIILVSLVIEKLILGIWNRFMRWEPVCRQSIYIQPARKPPAPPSQSAYGQSVQSQSGATSVPAGCVWGKGKTVVTQSADDCPLAFYNVSKSYGNLPIFRDKTETYLKGDIYFLTSPSGSGKTTEFRLFAGLEAPDSGEVASSRNLSMVFQEDRLCEGFSALRNLEMVTGSRSVAAAHLKRLLPEEELTKPSGQLSGGMKRRVAVARAMAARSDAVLLDEPLNGLDEANRHKTAQYIVQEQKGRTLLIATHNMEDIEELAK
jgi:NitT/TauT family transport system permease protein